MAAIDYNGDVAAARRSSRRHPRAGRRVPRRPLLARAVRLAGADGAAVDDRPRRARDRGVRDPPGARRVQPGHARSTCPIPVIDEMIPRAGSIQSATGEGRVLGACSTSPTARSGRCRCPTRPPIDMATGIDRRRRRRDGEVASRSPTSPGRSTAAPCFGYGTTDGRADDRVPRRPTRCSRSRLPVRVRLLDGRDGDLPDRRGQAPRRSPTSSACRILHRSGAGRARRAGVRPRRRGARGERRRPRDPRPAVLDPGARPARGGAVAGGGHGDGSARARGGCSAGSTQSAGAGTQAVGRMPPPAAGGRGRESAA